MAIEAWIVATPAVFDVIAPAEGADVEPWHRVYTGAVTGYFKNPAGKAVYNVIGQQDAIQALIDALEAQQAGSVSETYSWMQGPGVDNLDVWPTDPTAVLALMNDHVTYDQDGNETSRTAPTLDTPNWGHVFLGQGERIFAGSFSNDFNGDFH